MKQQITERLQTLQAERDAGRKMLAELDARRGSLTTTLLRIEGAIQVLTEIAGDAETAGPNASSPGDESADR